MHKTHNKVPRRFMMVILAVILLMQAAPALAAPKEGKDYQWVPSAYAESDLNQDKQVSMKTEYASYAPGVSNVYVEIHNASKDTLGFGLGFALERRQKDGWYRVEQIVGKDTLVISFPALGFVANPGSTLGCLTNILMYTGELAEVEYRIVKSVSYDATPSELFLLSAEFSIAKGGYDGQTLSGYTALSSLPVGYGAAGAALDELSL